MGLLLVGLFLFCFLNHPSVYAATIVDVEEVSRFVGKEQLSDCEWIDHFEVRTTTTFQELVSGIPPVALYVEPPKNFTKGQWNPCLPEYADKDGNLPAYCPTEPLPEPNLAPLVMGFALTRVEYSDPIVREWSELEVGFNTVRRKICVVDDDPTCDDLNDPIQTPTPEPASWVLALTGLAGILLLRRRSRTH
jgi:MYXO-CTERM domain-containing protein